MNYTAAKKMPRSVPAYIYGQNDREYEAWPGDEFTAQFYCVIKGVVCWCIPHVNELLGLSRWPGDR